MSVYFWIFVIVFAALLGVGLYFYIKERRDTLELGKLLQGTAWEIVRFMENNPRHTPSKVRRGLSERHKEYVTEPAKELHKVPEYLIGDLGDSVALTSAIDTLKVGEDEGNAFWHKTQGMRNGVQSFIEIMVLGNPKSAYYRMIDHMKRQRDEWETKGKKGSPNFTQLKLVLGLPTAWPKEDMPEIWAEKGIDIFRQKNIVTAARRYRRMILNRLTFRAWPAPGHEEEERKPYTGEDLLIQMREYIR